MTISSYFSLRLCKNAALRGFARLDLSGRGRRKDEWQGRRTQDDYPGSHLYSGSFRLHQPTTRYLRWNHHVSAGSASKTAVVPTIKKDLMRSFFKITDGSYSNLTRSKKSFSRSFLSRCSLANSRYGSLASSVNDGHRDLALSLTLDHSLIVELCRECIS